VETLPLPLGQAQGLCWANGSLYVVVSGITKQGVAAGVYRARSPDDGETFDKPELLFALKNREGGIAASEHGPHAVHAAGDGKIYLIGGNAAAVPDGLAPDSPVQRDAEDVLLPRITDALDPHVMAPGGWFLQCDADGNDRRLLCAGLRNAYDFAFTSDGEAITFDSDMEWDVGTAWYRPTRITHLVWGGEFGWRNGSAKWPADYPDSLPPVLDIGFASPTGMTSGRDLRFPPRWRRLIFMADWAYGRIYAADLMPAGASYRGKVEVFASKRPWCLTSLVANPTDGALYAVSGGRSSQSELWRFTYAGDEPATQPDNLVADSQFALRRRLQSFHGRRNPCAIEAAWRELANEDPFIRFAARVAVESQETVTWQERALAEPDARTAIEALIALVRCGDRALEPRVIAALERISLQSLPQVWQIAALRAYELCFMRMGHPSAQDAARVTARLAAVYPSNSNRVNQELAQLLAYLEFDDLVRRTVPLLTAAPSSDQILYATVLRDLKRGSTPAIRREYFRWINAAESNFQAGLNLDDFLRQIRASAVGNLTAQERSELSEFIQPPAQPPLPMTNSRQLVRHWSPDDFASCIDDCEHGRNFATGKRVFEAASCIRCHRFGMHGGAVGPNLTIVGNHYTSKEILESILQPSKVVSDQYAATDFVLRGKPTISGRVQSEDDRHVVVRISPWNDSTEIIEKSNIRQRRPSRVSPMPDGLLDVFERDEILDLIAYLRSAGNPRDQAFQH